MKGYDAFVDICGDMTVLNLMEIIIMLVFLYKMYIGIKDYLIKKHELEQAREEKLNEAIEAAKNYPEYRQQSLDIQKEFNEEISRLSKSQGEIMDRIVVLEESNKTREVNRLRDLLLQNYRYYTDPVRNPDKSWTEMESDAFWALFKDYEDLNGDGYMHTIVEPAMRKLQVVSVNLLL